MCCNFVSFVQTCTGPDPPGSPAVHRPVRLPGPQVWVLLLISSELHWNVIEIAILLGGITEDCDLNTSPEVLNPPWEKNIGTCVKRVSKAVSSKISRGRLRHNI